MDPERSVTNPPQRGTEYKKRKAPKAERRERNASARSRRFKGGGSSNYLSISAVPSA